MSLSHLFKVHLSNFKAAGINAGPRSEPPYCVRGNFDGRIFNTEYFHGAAMAPMWALDISFDYTTPSLEALSGRFLVLECYGGETFLGMCRLDLWTLAQGPTAVQLHLREGARVIGTLSFTAVFALVANVTLRFSRLALSNVATRSGATGGTGNTGGYDSNPNPYLSYGFASSGAAPIESAISPGSTRPEWEQLPPLHARVTFEELCALRVSFDLRHSRNGYTAGMNDPLMASFLIALETLAIEPGRDQVLQLREMVHSLPHYPFPFSSELRGTLEILNCHRVAQQPSGVITDEGIVGALAPGTGPRSPSRGNLSPPRSGSTGSGLGVGAGLNGSFTTMSQCNAYNTTGTAVNNNLSTIIHNNNTSYSAVNNANTSTSVALNTSAAANATNTSLMMAAAAASTGASLNFGSGPVTAEDIATLERVCDDQAALLRKVQARLDDVRRRRAQVQAQIDEGRRKEAAAAAADASRRATMEKNLRDTLLERQQLEESIKVIRQKIEEERSLSSQIAADRERARRALEEEQKEALMMQEKVLKLRDEMHAHLAEEERRYQVRIRDAEDARRRAQQDSVALAALEQRLTEAENKTILRRS